jgi:ribosomal protein L11 methyltransferase
MNGQRGVSSAQSPDAREGWIEATLQFVNAGDEDTASFIAECVEKGAAGGLEAAGDFAGGIAEDPRCESCGRSSFVRVYFPGAVGIQELVDILEERIRAMKYMTRSPNIFARIIRCRGIEQEAWATQWQEGFPPEKVSRSLWVVPPWRTPRLPCDALPMVLEPGQAFGTGKHPTTRHCLEFLEEIRAQAEGELPWSFLDVGCGSGILSIAACKLGSTRVVGLEIDPDALAVARRNRALNRLVGAILLVNGTTACCRGPFDLIAANLDARTLARHPEPIWGSLRRGGLAILSGILTEEEPEILASFLRAGFVRIKEKRDPEQGWVSLLLEKPCRPQTESDPNR